MRATKKVSIEFKDGEVVEVDYKQCVEDTLIIHHAYKRKRTSSGFSGLTFSKDWSLSMVDGRKFGCTTFKTLKMSKVYAADILDKLPELKLIGTDDTPTLEETRYMVAIIIDLNIHYDNLQKG